jgi:hypothetical protein
MVSSDTLRYLPPSSGKVSNMESFMPNPADLIWIVEAAMEYKRSRDWLDSQIRDGKLGKYSIPGDKRVYLSRKELEQLLSPRRVDDNE